MASAIMVVMDALGVGILGTLWFIAPNLPARSHCLREGLPVSD
jgi:hypothetical protein